MKAEDKDPYVYIEDIREYVDRVISYSKKLDKGPVLDRAMRMDAIFRCLEIIGEASRNVPRKFRLQHPQIPWRQMVALRNVLIHEYRGVKPSRIWKIIRTDIPKLKPQIKKLLAHRRK